MVYSGRLTLFIHLLIYVIQCLLILLLLLQEWIRFRIRWNYKKFEWNAIQKSAFSKLWILIFELKQLAIHKIHLFLLHLCACFSLTPETKWKEFGPKKKINFIKRYSRGFIWPEIITVDEFISIENLMWIHLYFYIIFFFLSLGNVYLLI